MAGAAVYTIPRPGSLRSGCCDRLLCIGRSAPRMVAYLSYMDYPLVKETLTKSTIENVDLN